MATATEHELYPWQQEAVDELISGSGRVLVVAPTGGGKSLTYQYPATQLDGMAIVITPLVALMADQVASLHARGIPATYLASNLDAGENQRRIDLALAGKVKLLYIAPERLALDWFVDGVLSKLSISLLAIDEAHCISQWGHDFRPEYLQIGELVQRLQPKRLLACTATATPLVRQEIVDRLGMPGAKQILRGFARDNLRLSVEEVSGPRAKQKRIAEKVKRVLGKPKAGKGTALVYTGSRKNAEAVAESLRNLGWRAEHYHAGMSGPARNAVQAKFQSDMLDVVAATNAFGMGIDRPDIRLVMHHALPESVEAYYQEVGRAGRDGEPAQGLLMISDPDIALRFRLIAGDPATSPEHSLRRREMLRAMIGYAETSACRHDSILEYFEDEAEELGGCSQCDNCVAAAEGRMSPDPDEEASAPEVREALGAIRALPFAVGPGTVANYLIGHGTAQVRKYDWQSRPQFGALKHRREDWTRRLLRRMLACGLLALEPEQQTLHVTRRGVDVIAGARPNPVRLPPLDRPTLRSGARDPRSATETLDGVAATLFERLKQWRRLRADAEGVPAYVICHDATLAAIAERRPLSSEDLLDVPGMGPAKLQRYGLQLLAELRAYVEEHPHSVEHRAPPQVAAATSSDNSGSPLYEALRAWRRRQTGGEIKLWHVASNEALQTIAEADPASPDELRALEVLDDP
ncbi:MAG: RecQ family ATP-dependent DNA helicase, partial [Chloroflexi bacterium]|nr:RecQ family ATP-dependent DNA helicase [Chloroflexota bacterium]